MSNLENALQQLRGEHKQAQLMVEKLGQAISVIQGLVGTAKSGNGVRQSRNISPAGRRRISLAQKARWARVKAQGTNAISIASRRGKLIMSQKKAA